MKKALISLLLLIPFLASAQTTPSSLSTLKGLIVQKLTPVGTDRLTGEKMRDVTNVLVEQLDLRTAFSSVAQLRQTRLGRIGLATKVQISDKGKEGSFTLREGDNTTPDNGATVIVDAAGNRYFRDDITQNLLTWWGLIDSHPGGMSAVAMHNDTVMANAIAWSAGANGTYTYHNGVLINESVLPTLKPRSSIVRLPAGTIYLSKPIQLIGNVVLWGEGGQSSGGTVIKQTDLGQPAYNMIELKGMYLDNISNAAVIRGIRFIPMGRAQPSYVIYSGTGGSFHSLRVEDCWFQVDGQYQSVYYNAGPADDVKFTNCTFDGSKSNPAQIRLGNAADTSSVAANFSFDNCTVYDFAAGFFKIERAKGVLIKGSRFYSATTRPPYVLDATGATKLEGLSFVNNRIEKAQDVIRLGKSTSGETNVVIANNTAGDLTRNFLHLAGSASDTLRGLKVVGNTLSGRWSLGDGYAPIQAHGGLKVGFSEFNNTITQLPGGNGSVSHSLPGAFMINVRGEEVNFPTASIPQMGYKLIDASVVDGSGTYSVEALRYDHFVVNNTTGSSYNLVLPVLPGYTRGREITISRLGNSAGPVTLYYLDGSRAIVTQTSPSAQTYQLPTFGAGRSVTLTFDGYNLVATQGGNQEPNLLNVTPLTTVVASTSVSTSGWVAGTYYQLVPPNLLVDGGVYRLNLKWQINGGGVDVLTETCMFVAAQAGGSTGTPADFPVQISSYEYSTANAVNLRPQKPTPGQVIGVAASITNAGMANPNAYLIYSVVRLQ